MKSIPVGPFCPKSVRAFLLQKSRLQASQNWTSELRHAAWWWNLLMEFPSYSKRGANYQVWKMAASISRRHHVFLSISWKSHCSSRSIVVLSSSSSSSCKIGKVLAKQDYSWVENLLSLLGELTPEIFGQIRLQIKIVVGSNFPDWINKSQKGAARRLSTFLHLTASSSLTGSE